MSKDGLNRTGNVVMGRCWQVKSNRHFYMNAFDAFGNRDHYDYFIYRRRNDTLATKLERQPEDKAIEFWNDTYEDEEFLRRLDDQKRKEAGSN